MTTESRPPWQLPRREFIGLGIGAFVLTAVPMVGWRRPRLLRRAIPVMGTIAEVVVLHHDEAAAQAAIDVALAELRRVEWLMTRFSATSDIGRANRGAARDGVRISAETADVLAAALDWSATSAGRFDPALGGASELWDVLNRQAPPASSEVARLAQRGFWRSVDVSRRADGTQAVRFTDADVHIDLGGIAKGHAVDRALRAVREAGIGRAMVVAGGDLATMGAGPEGGDWQVGIRDPHDARRLAGSLQIRDRAVATSGDYERYFRWRGERFHHLIDPATGAPRRTSYRSQTVVAATCRDADAAATATFGLDEAEARRVAGRAAGVVEVHPLA